MNLLKALAEIRNPFCDLLVGGITLLGEETFFTIVGMVIFWCINKKWGYRFLLIGLSGSIVTQLLKAIFLIPRPWVLDPEFQIVESAREAAGGYSFPSGHTQSAVGVFGTLAVWLRKKWLTVVCIVLMLLVGFSRMYLGVHTPLDVGVGLICGVITVLGLTWLFEKTDSCRKGKIGVGMGLLALAFIYLLYMYLAPVTERNIAEFDAHAVENAWKLLGTLSGLLLAWWVDDRYTHFNVKASWPVQILKCVVGMLILVGVKSGLKPVFNLLFDGAYFTHALRYFIMVCAGAILWPMSFPFWNRLAIGKTFVKKV